MIVFILEVDNRMEKIEEYILFKWFVAWGEVELIIF